MSKLSVYEDFPQNSPPWDFLRLGILTASDFNLILRRGVGGGVSKTRNKRINGMVYELITGFAPDTKWSGNRFTERGHEQEQTARDLYMAMRELKDEDVSQPAFIVNNDLIAGCSPDMLVGKDGGCEIKTMSGDLFCELMLDPDVPSQHRAQVQGSMLVTGRKWWDVMIYCPGMAPLLRRVTPDAEYQRELRDGLKVFNAEVERNVMKLSGETVKTCRARMADRFAEIVTEWQAEQQDAATPPAIGQVAETEGMNNAE